MLIIDRYLLRQFLQTFLVCFISLMGLFVVFDLFTNMDEFLRCGEKSGSVVKLIATYYGYRSVLFFDRTSALLNLIAAMFTVAWIQRHNELTALMAAGISRLRVVKPVIIAAIVISFGAAVSRECVIPQLRDELSRRPQDLLGDKAQPVQLIYDNQTDIQIHGASSFGDEKRIEAPNFFLPRGLDAWGNELKAAQAYFKPAESGRPAGYLLVEVSEPKNIDARPSLVREGKAIVFTRRDGPAWLAPGQCFVVSDVDFEQLTGGKNFREYASTWQLIRALHNPSLSFDAQTRVAVHARFVQPILDVTLLFLGLPLVLTRHNRNVFVAIGMALGLVTVFILSVIGLQSLGWSLLLPPVVAAWAPVLVFVPAAVALADGMSK